MDRLFRFDMYPHDWLLDTSVLTPEEAGMYVQVVMLIYAKRGPIFFDPDELSRKLSDCSVRKARSLVESIVKKGEIHGGLFMIREGFIYQKRSEHELSNKRTHLERSSNGGRTKAENESHRKKNKDLSSSGSLFPLSTPSPTASPSHKKDSKESLTPTPLPPWLPVSLWHDFLEMRKKIKKPTTPRAEMLILKKLEEFKNGNHDPIASLEQSIRNGWQDVYRPRAEAAGAGSGRGFGAAQENHRGGPSGARDDRGEGTKAIAIGEAIIAKRNAALQASGAAGRPGGTKPADPAAIPDLRDDEKIRGAGFGDGDA